MQIEHSCKCLIDATNSGPMAKIGLPKERWFWNFVDKEYRVLDA